MLNVTKMQVLRLAFLICISATLASIITDVKLNKTELEQRVVTLENLKPYEASIQTGSMGALLTSLFNIDVVRTAGYETCFKNYLHIVFYFSPGPNRQNITIGEITGLNTSIVFNDKEIPIKYGEVKCVNYEIDRNFSYRWKLNSYPHISEKENSEIRWKIFSLINLFESGKNKIPQGSYISSGNLHIDTDEFAKMENKSFIIIWIITFFIVVGGLKAFKEIKDFVIKGKDYF